MNMFMISNNISIHFTTIQFSASSILFLCVLLLLNNNYIGTSLYTKPKDGHCYLNFNRCHPIKLKKEEDIVSVYALTYFS